MRIIPTRTPPDRGYEHDDGYQGGQDGWSPRGAYEDEDLEEYLGAFQRAARYVYAAARVYDSLPTRTLASRSSVDSVT